METVPGFIVKVKGTSWRVLNRRVIWSNFSFKGIALATIKSISWVWDERRQKWKQRSAKRLLKKPVEGLGGLYGERTDSRRLRGGAHRSVWSSLSF